MRLRLHSFAFLSFLLFVIAQHVGAQDGGGDGGNFIELQFPGAVASEEHPMYLCADPSYAGRINGDDGDNGRHVKMVYTYVNGRRTECMSEYEFVSRFRARVVLPPPPAPGDDALEQESVGPQFAGRDFSEQDMYGVDFQFADLQKANFFRCDMRGAKLRAADCRGASFEGALVKGADFSNADLSDANLRGAYFVNTDLSGAKGLTLESLRMVSCLYRCKLDDDLYELFVQYCSSKMKDVSWNWGVDEAKRRGLQ